MGFTCKTTKLSGKRKVFKARQRLIGPKHTSQEKKISKLDFIKMKISCSLKDPVKSVKTQATEWEKIFVSHISNKVLVSRIYEELSKLNSKKANNPIRPWAKKHEETLH